MISVEPSGPSAVVGPILTLYYTVGQELGSVRISAAEYSAGPLELLPNEIIFLGGSVPVPDVMLNVIGEPTQCCPDFDGDDRIGTYDLLWLVNYWLENKDFFGQAPVPAGDLSCADNDGSGAVDTADILALINFWLGCKDIMIFPNCTCDMWRSQAW